MDLEIDREVEYAGASPANFGESFFFYFCLIV